MMPAMGKWADRLVVALVTLLLGAAAQGLLSWRELGVLTKSVATLEQMDTLEHEQIVGTLNVISERQREALGVLSTLVERLESTRDALKDHKETPGHTH